MAKAKEFRDHDRLKNLKLFTEDACKELFELVNELKQTKKVEKPHLIRA